MRFDIQDINWATVAAAVLIVLIVLWLLRR